MGDLERAVDTVVNQCLGVRPGEGVVVVADTGTRRMGNILREAAAAVGADAAVLVMDPRGADGEEPPPTVAAALCAADVFIVPTTRSLSHTRARRAATEAGARGATLPGITEEILSRLMACDLATLQRRSRALAELLTRSDAAHFTCPTAPICGSTCSGAPGSPTTATSRVPGPSGTCPAGRGSSLPSAATA